MMTVTVNTAKNIIQTRAKEVLAMFRNNRTLSEVAEELDIQQIRVRDALNELLRDYEPGKGTPAPTTALRKVLKHYKDNKEELVMLSRELPRTLPIIGEDVPMMAKQLKHLLNEGAPLLQIGGELGITRARVTRIMYAVLRYYWTRIVQREKNLRDLLPAIERYMEIRQKLGEDSMFEQTIQQELQQVYSAQDTPLNPEDIEEDTTPTPLKDLPAYEYLKEITQLMKGGATRARVISQRLGGKINHYDIATMRMAIRERMDTREVTTSKALTELANLLRKEETEQNQPGVTVDTYPSHLMPHKGGIQVLISRGFSTEQIANRYNTTPNSLERFITHEIAQ